jgi:hypothetical protein
VILGSISRIGSVSRCVSVAAALLALDAAPSKEQTLGLVGGALQGLGADSCMSLLDLGEEIQP